VTLQFEHLGQGYRDQGIVFDHQDAKRLHCLTSPPAPPSFTQEAISRRRLRREMFTIFRDVQYAWRADRRGRELYVRLWTVDH
jgi:hypothetical protein